MKLYTLKLIPGETLNYHMYDGDELVSDEDLDSIFRTDPGAAYFTFDFNGGTTVFTNEFWILNSMFDAMAGAMELPEGTIREDYNFYGSWDGETPDMTDFYQLSGKSLDAAELTFLMGKVKSVPTVVQTSGDSYDDVMSQRAVTKLITSGDEAPSDETPGFPGQIYEDSTESMLYFWNDSEGAWKLLSPPPRISLEAFNELWEEA